MKPSILALLLVATVTAEAATYSSRPSMSYRPAPSSPQPRFISPPVRKVVPLPTQPKTVVIQKNVTVHQTTTHVQQASSGGGGWFQGIVSSFAGASLANWLFPPKQQPAQQAIDCQLEQNKALAVCQPAK